MAELNCKGCLFKYHNGSELGLCGYKDLFAPIKDMDICPINIPYKPTHFDNTKGKTMNVVEKIGEAALLELAWWALHRA